LIRIANKELYLADERKCKVLPDWCMEDNIREIGT